MLLFADSMKMKLFGSVFLAGCLSLGARTWTSADGGMALEGNFKSFDAESNQVVLEVEGNEVKFELTKLSAEDQSFVKKKAAGEQEAGISELLAKSTLYQMQDGELKKVTVGEKPKYYLLYFSASW